MKIAHRLLVGLLGSCVLAAVGVGSVFFLFETGREHRRLDLVGGMVADQVFDHLEARMREHREPLGPDAFGDHPLLPPVRRVFLVNAAGAVRVTSDQALRGRSLDRRAAGCRECHEDATRRGVLFEGALRWARPLSAEASCRGCHTTASKYLGCLVVDLDLSSYRRDVAKEIGAGLLLLLLMFALIGWVTLVLARRLISRRLERVDAVMERFEGGDLTIRAAVSGGDEITRVETRFNRMAGALLSRQEEMGALVEQLRAANDNLRNGEVLTHRAYDAQRVLYDILRFSLGNKPIDAVLQRALDMVLSLPWLGVEAKGCVFVAEGNVLVMRAQSGLSPALREACRRVNFGHCLCGRAAAERRFVHAAVVGDDHVVRHEGMTEHGHYCVPVLSGQVVVGVLSLYLSRGHVPSMEEASFLSAVANTLAAVISRRGAEERLRLSEERFRTLAEGANDMIFIVDRERRVVFMNGTGARLLHRAPEALVGARIGEILPPETVERMVRSIEQVLDSGEALHLEAPFAFPDGESWLSTTLVALPGDEAERVGVFGISRDITSQRRAQAERERLIAELQNLLHVVAQSQKEWQSTFDGITDMVSILDDSNRILKVNKAYAEYFGAHPRDVVGHACHEFCIAAHEGKAACPLLEAARASGTENQEVLDPRTGRLFRIAHYSYSSGGGEVDRHVRLAEDVTDERARAQRLMLSERLAALGQMASGIAHEVNNPLASIAGCAEALLGRIERGRIDPHLFREYLGIVQEEVFRCKKITTAMLSFVRQGSHETAAVRLNEALDRALELLGFQGRLRSVTVVRDLPPDVPAVLASEGELRQVLLIVLTNALDAMRDEGTLRCGGYAADGMVTLSIADTGPGIPEEVMHRIFTPFLTTKGAQGGTGLGLSIAKRIVEDFGGTITFNSVPGEGTTVLIAFPAATTHEDS